MTFCIDWQLSVIYRGRLLPTYIHTKYQYEVYYPAIIPKLFFLTVGYTTGCPPLWGESKGGCQTFTD